MERESRYVQFARRAYEEAKVSLPMYTHRNSPKTYTFPQLAACVMLKFYLNMTYRDFEEWLLATDKVCEVLELEQIPDHSTLARTYRKLSKARLDQMQVHLLDEAEVEEEAIAGDSTVLLKKYDNELSCGGLMKRMQRIIELNDKRIQMAALRRGKSREQKTANRRSKSLHFQALWTRCVKLNLIMALPYLLPFYQFLCNRTIFCPSKTSSYKNHKAE